jgi:hypothetical protein
MIFQLDYYTVMGFVLISYAGISLILFFTGIYIMQMLAKKKEWGDSFKIPLNINFIWLLVSLAIGIPLSMFYGDSIVIEFIRFGANIIVGIIIGIRYYEKDKGDVIQFILIIQVVLFIIGVIFSNIFSILILFVLTN